MVIQSFSHSVVSDSLRPCGLQHARLPCPSPTPGTCSNSCPLSWWCHSTISSSVIPFSSCPQSLPASESFPKVSILHHSAFFTVQLLHPYITTGKTIALTRWTFVGKVMSLLFNMLSRLLKTFLSRSECRLISWLQSPSAVILEPTVCIVSPSISHEVMGPDAMILVFWMLGFKPTFSLPLSLSSRGSLVLPHFLP